MSTVALVKTENYDNIKEDIRKSLELIGGISRFVKPGQNVLLKPNFFGVKSPDLSATDLRFLNAVIDLVKEQDAVPVIGELIADDKPGINKKAFRERGIIKLALQQGIKIIDFQTAKLVKKKVENHLALPEVDVVQKMYDADVVINLPKLKGHPLTFITGAVKNCFGCIRTEARGEIHREYPREEFSKAVVDTFSTMRFHLNIMDAVVAMDGDEAPAFGSPAKIGYVIASTDAVAVDAVAARITGHKLKYTPTVKYAHSQKLGTGRLKEIKIVGDQPEIKEFKKHSNYEAYVKEKEQSPNEAKITEKVFPQIIQEKCIKCFACVNNCPAEAIAERDGKIEICREKCIQCYRCLEVCPNNAVKLDE